jgi:radical SAM protein (TIGR01212 family)
LKQISTIGRYFKNKYKKKIYKIPLSIKGFTCPNIDGTKAKGGCIFCENDSFSPNLQKKGKPKVYITPQTQNNTILNEQLIDLRKQLKATKLKFLEREKNSKKVGFLAYFQSFTNTYAPVETLRVLYYEALKDKSVVGISIGTRADSISNEVFDLLLEIKSKGYEVFIEYGVQTVFDDTLEYVNRAEKISDIVKIVTKTKELGFKVCIHLIFGLPNETKQMMLQSVKEVISWNIDSIKIHPLYVVKNTALAIEYYNNSFNPIDENEYIDVLVDALEIIPNSITIQRITAGINDDTILGSNWCKNKNNQIKNIKKALLNKKMNY